MKQGDIVKALRKNTGLNQVDFGSLIGKAQEDISAIENGKQFLKVPDWVMIAKKFKSEAAQLIAEGLMFREVVDFNRIKLA